MIKHKATPRYAHALFHLSAEKNLLNDVYEDIHQLKSLLEKNAELRFLFEDPEIPSQKRIAVFERLFKSRVQPLTFQFLCFLEKKDRLSLAVEICSTFEQMVWDHNNILRAEITSSQTLEGHQVSEIKNRLQARFQKKIEPELRVDPSLLGGFKVQIGDQILDLSITGQLERFQQKILKA